VSTCVVNDNYGLKEFSLARRFCLYFSKIGESPKRDDFPKKGDQNLRV
jgi:hypothetical protein